MTAERDLRLLDELEGLLREWVDIARRHLKAQEEDRQYREKKKDSRLLEEEKDNQ